MVWGDVLFLQYGGYYTGNIGDILNQWAQFGFFSYLLPFLLIFAMVFGVLSSMKLFAENRAVDGVIALAVGMMALQFNIVPQFFAELFPRFAVGLSILLVLIILTGFFIDPKKSGIMYTFLGIGAIVAIVVLVSTSGSVGWSSGYWWYSNWPVVAGLVFIIILIALIIGVGTPREHSAYSLTPWRMMGGPPGK